MPRDVPIGERCDEPSAPAPPAAGEPDQTLEQAPADCSDLPAFLPPEARTADTRALLAELAANARAVAALKRHLERHVDPAGLTRPPRHPDERAWLAVRGQLGPFVERDVPYVARTSWRPNAPPAADHEPAA